MATTTQNEGVTAQAQEKAQEVAGQAKEQAQQAAGQAKNQLRTQVDERSTQAGRQLSQQASDIRTVGEQLREQGKDGPAKIADQAADRAERLGSYLEESDAERILGDVEDFARRKPWVVMAGGLALGFAASRFLKASQGDRYRSLAQRSGTGYGYQQGGLPGYAGPTPSTPGTGNELSSGVTPGTTPTTAPPTAPTTPATPGPGAL